MLFVGTKMNFCQCVPHLFSDWRNFGIRNLNVMALVLLWSSWKSVQWRPQLSFDVIGITFTRAPRNCMTFRQSRTPWWSLCITSRNALSAVSFSYVSRSQTSHRSSVSTQVFRMCSLILLSFVHHSLPDWYILNEWRVGLSPRGCES